MYKATLLIMLATIATIQITWAGNVETFTEALSIAYQNNPELQAQIQKANASRGVFVQNSQYLNPSLLLEGENIGGSGVYKRFESAETTLSLTQPIPLGGKRHYLQKASLADYIAMKSSIESKKSEIYISLGHAYVDALYAKKWYQVTQKLSKLNQEIVSDIKKRKQSGASAEVDLKLAQIQLGEAQIQQSRAKRNIQKAKAVLQRILGIDEFSINEISDQGIPHNLLTWNDIEQTINHSAFIQEKQRQLKASRETIVAVKKDVWPTLSLQLGARHFSDDNENALVVSASAPLPVFDKNQGAILSAEANYTKIMKELRASRLEMQQKLRASYLDAVQYNEESVCIKNSLLPLAKKSAFLASQGYQRGLYSYIELSNAMRTLFEEERRYQESHANRDKALITILGLLKNN